mgnify:CR=1 FL=1
MTVAITKNQGLTTHVSSTGFDSQQIAVLKSSYAKSLDPTEFQVYLATASHLKLNPFAREIYAIKYGGQMSLVTSIDGYRKMSARSGRFLGVTNGRLFVRLSDGSTTTVPHEEYDPDNHKIISGTIGIRVLDYPEPVEATATMKAYHKPTPNWKDMPDIMILKCAEAAAHRKAALLPDPGINANVGQVYIEEEIANYVDVQPQPVQPQPKPAIPAGHVPSRRVQVKDSIIETIPEKPKQSQQEEDVTNEIDPDVDAAVDAAVAQIVEIEQAGEAEQTQRVMLPEVEKVITGAMDWFRQLGADENGIVYAENQICDKFGVEDFADLTDAKALKTYIVKELKTIMEQESYLPIRIATS